MAKILIVDDDVLLGKLVQDWLLLDKHDAEIVVTGDDALSKLNTGAFDLILLDWDLPDMTGIDICKAYRDGGGMAPILMLTGRTEIDEKELALDAGADDYLTKPFHIKELGARVRSLVRRNTGELARAPAIAPPPQPQAAGPDARVCVVCSGIFRSPLVEVCPSDGGNTVAVCTQAVVGKEFGPYTATGLLGVGAWSEVYEGQAAGALAAIKILHVHLASDPINVARFEREARALSGIKHDSIAAVLGGGKTVEGRPYIIMEYVSGMSIERYLRTSGAMPVQKAVQLVLAACEALEAAHRNGFIHRDIKPSNIFMTNDVPPRLKLMDFGLAKAVTMDGGTLASLTTAGDVMGTPAYMSPEQVRGDSLDCRSDIYALGLVFYELVSGIRAIEGTTSFEVMTKHLCQYPLPIATVNPTVRISSELEDVIFKAMAKDAEDRFQTARELQQALGTFVAV